MIIKRYSPAFSVTQPQGTSFTKMKQHPVQPYQPKLIKRPYVFASGMLLTFIGWMSVIYDPSFVVAGAELGGIIGFVVALMALPLWLAGTPLMLSGVNLSQHYHKVHATSKLLLMSPFLILLFFISMQFVALGVYGTILGLGLWLTAKNINRKTPHLTRKPQAVSRKSAKKTAKQSTETGQVVSVYENASRLTLLLSHKGNALLNDLVDAINKLHTHVPYLEKHHTYLSVSVSELINDLTENSINRLDSLADEFVHNGMVNAEEKKLFARQHEAHIQAMLHEHLDEVNQLNQRILEKKMASFNEVGNTSASQFRNSVMELKILLRWLIAKTPENQVSSHEVLLKRMEDTTLKHMQDVFYKSDTTDEQRAELQQQVEDLIGHFKSQSPDHAKQQSASDDPLLLEYSENQALDFQTNLGSNSATQDFIEFNAQYVKQLKRHW